MAGINDVDCTSSSLAQTEEGEVGIKTFFFSFLQIFCLRVSSIRKKLKTLGDAIEKFISKNFEKNYKLFVAGVGSGEHQRGVEGGGAQVISIYR